MGDINPNDLTKQGSYSDLPARVGSAIILAALSIYATWEGGLTFSLLILVASLLVFWEFRNITSKSMPLIIGVFAFMFLGLFCLSWFFQSLQTGLNLLGVSFVALLVWEYFFKKTIWAASGLMYAALPFLALVLLRQGDDGIVVVLFLFACVWGADTFAYFTGKTLGGPKLWPAVSPKKTWSGFIGGLVGAVLLTTAVLWFFEKPFGLGSWLFAVILAIFSQAGDLFESSIKRKFDVKDSGKIIPGHGGVLDRIDGLIFAAIIAMLVGVAANNYNFTNEGIPSALLRVIG